MGRVKLEMKRIESKTNRQVTFSKRRNGLIKKAYELSVLCDVAIALIMFSPSGRLSLFSAGQKSLEQILTRYANLPEHERQPDRVICLFDNHHPQNGRRLLDHEDLREALAKLRDMDTDSHINELQRYMTRCRSHLDDTQRKLKVFEGNSSDITTLKEAFYHEQILENTLSRVCLRKQTLKTKDASVSSPGAPDSDNVQVRQDFMLINGYVVSASSSSSLYNLDRLGVKQRKPSVRGGNFLGPRYICPLESRDGRHKVTDMSHQPQASNPFRENNLLLSNEHIQRPNSEEVENEEYNEFDINNVSLRGFKYP